MTEMQPPPAEPVVNWAPPEAPPPPRSGEPVGALHNNRPPSTFTLGDAITTGFGLVAKPAFIVPVLVIGVVVNAIVALLLQPLMGTTITPGTQLGNDQILAIIRGALASISIAIIGGILVNLYGQIWAVEATAGPLPTTNQVITLAGRRWIGIIGTGIVVGLISLGLLVATFLVTVLAFGILGNLGILVMVALIIVDIWVGARLSMSGWLAADGLSISNSINGSWQITRLNLLRIIGWGLAYGLIYAIVSGILGAVLAFVPVIGPGISQAVSLALGYGAGVTLFRRTQAAATPPMEPQAAAPSVVQP